MDLDSGWLSLADAVGRLVARDVQEVKAKVDICAAIAELRMRVRVHAADRGAALPAIYEINDLQIPGELNPTRLDWARSCPAVLFPWRTRSARSGDGWQDRDITLIEACVEDFVVELCKDVSSVPLPDRQSITGHPQTSSDHLRYLRELARAKWSPCQATVDALGGLASRKTISLSQTVSIMAFGSRVEPTGDGRDEDVALEQQAGRALCHAALKHEVTMRGSDISRRNHVKPIPELFFADPRCLGDDPNS